MVDRGGNAFASRQFADGDLPAKPLHDDANRLFAGGFQRVALRIRLPMFCAMTGLFYLLPRPVPEPTITQHSSPFLAKVADVEHVLYTLEVRRFLRERWDRRSGSKASISAQLQI